MGPGNFMDNLSDNMNSCSWQGMVAAKLTSERPGSVVRTYIKNTHSYSHCDCYSLTYFRYIVRFRNYHYTKLDTQICEKCTMKSNVIFDTIIQRNTSRRHSLL